MRIRRIASRIRAVDTRPTIVPADICPQLEAIELDADADDDAYTVQRIAPATWSATYRHHRALGGDERQATDRLEALLRGDASRSEAWSRRIWTGHVLSADPIVLEGRRADLAADLAAIVPLSPTEWPAVELAWRRASSLPIGRYRIPDMLTHPDHLDAMRSACRRGAAGPLLAAAEVALVRSVWVPAALAWSLTALAALVAVAVGARGLGGLL